MSIPTCPICGSRLEGPLAEWPRFPFCSEKCKTIDLGRWLSERYTVAKEEPVEDDSERDDDP